MVRNSPVLALKQNPLLQTKPKTLRFVHKHKALREKINPMLLEPSQRRRNLARTLPKFKDKIRFFQLNPSKHLSRELMEKLKDSIEFDGVGYGFAVPLDRLTEACFEPPHVPIEPALKTDKFRISKALAKAKKPHSYMSMADKLCGLRMDVLKDLAVGANIPSEKLEGLKKREIATLLWKAVECAEKDKPPNLSTVEFHSIFREHGVSLSPHRTVKETFALLSYESILRIAKAKRVEVPTDNPTKEQLVDAVWKAKDLYVHNLNVYKAKRLIYEAGTRKKNNSIMQYLKLRKGLFDDLASASIRMLKFKVEPYVFACENLWCLGISGNYLLFCAQPCETKVSVRKKYVPVKFDLQKRTLLYSDE